MKQIVRLIATLLVLLVMSTSSLFAAMEEGNSTLGGVNGYIVIPSAQPVSSGENASVTTGYSAIFALPDGFAHIPFIQFGFGRDFEVGLAVDIAEKADVLLSTKWRFVEKESTSVSFGMVGQALEVGDATKFAAQAYFASSFTSTFISWPSKTTILVGYTFDDTMNTDIDFGMGFQAPLLEKVFKGNVDFLIDFGNVSYSSSPSGGKAGDRGLLNIGARLLPVVFMPSTTIAADVRLIDILDHSGRALSAGISISFRP
ncbi:MAG: hypothetical protein AB7S52_07575 [Sphaerochaetaceae bacterium]